jgi:Phage P22-like portal protein
MPDMDDDNKSDSEFERLKQWVVRDQNHCREWQKQAEECYGFVSGSDQWSSEDRALLEKQNRPIITFNRIDPVIDSVSGLEVNNRQEVKFFPRHIGNAGVDDLLTAAAAWCRDECYAEDEESDAFRDQIICGMGWIETRLDYDTDPDGMIQIDRVDPLEMVWDSASKKKNLAEARRVARIRDLPLSVVEDMFPDVDVSDLHASWAMDTSSMANSPHDATQAVFYTEDQSELIDKNQMLCRLVEIQWWEHETEYQIIDPLTEKSAILTVEEYKKAKSRLKQMGIFDFPSAKIKTKKYYKAFLGNTILEKKDGPKQGGFTLKCMTGKRDRNHGVFYGLVKSMIDPQKWANKWLSQVLHIVNTNAKGGIMAEESAFSNPQEAIDNWADPASVTLVKNGAITGNKIQPKPQTPWPQGLEGLMQFAISSIRDASGVNLELLGQADRAQPGILEHQRKQSAMTILAGLFDSLRRYRKEQGRLLLYYITNFISDGRLIKIGGPESQQYVPLVRNPDTVKYDVIVDDTPNSVNIKDQTWYNVMQLMPFLQKMPVPLDVWLDVLKYSPLPASLVSDISVALTKQASQPKEPDPKIAVAQLDLQTKQLDLQIQQSEQKNAEIRAQVDIGQMQAEHQMAPIRAAEAQANVLKNKTQAILNLANADSLQHNKAVQNIETLVEAMSKLSTRPPKQ